MSRPQQEFLFRTDVERLQDDTLERLDRFRSSYWASGVVLQWTDPEVEELSGVEILVAPSGIYWVESPSPLSETGWRRHAISNVIRRIEDRDFRFGGEQLAQAVFRQFEHDGSTD